MGGLARAAWLLVLIAIGVGVVSLFFASLAIVLAVVGPVAGALYLRSQWTVARRLLTSGGRLPIADGVRVIGVARTRTLGLSHLVAGIGGLLVGLSPAVFWSGTLPGALTTLVVGVLVSSAAAALSARVLATATGVDVLPPER